MVNAAKDGALSLPDRPDVQELIDKKEQDDVNNVRVFDTDDMSVFDM